MSEFSQWWHETGSGIAALPNHDHEEHAERVAQRAWDAASDPVPDHHGERGGRL